MSKKISLSKTLYWIASKNPELGRSLLEVWKQIHWLFGWYPHPGLVWISDTFNYRFPLETKLSNGMKIKVNWNDLGIGFQIHQNGVYEKNTVNLISQLLSSGQVFVDAGAHCGQYTLIASKIVGDAGEVHSFDPDPQTFKLLSESVKLNDLNNVRLNQVALSNESGVKTFYFASSHCTGASSLATPYTYSGASCEVKCITLGEYLQSQNVTHVDLLKIDVEGHELDVFAGGAWIFEGQNRAIAISEFNEEPQNYFGHSCKDLEEFFTQRNYQLYVIGEELPVNVLAIPSERLAILEGLEPDLRKILKPYQGLSLC